MKPDFTKANAVIDEYLSELADPNKIPGQFGLTWLEFCMQRNGLIQDVRLLKFGEAHAIWYACLVLTRRVTEVTKVETMAHPSRKSRTAITIRSLRNPKYGAFNTVIAVRLRNFLEWANKIYGQG